MPKTRRPIFIYLMTTKAEIQRLYEALNTWQAVGEKLGINKAVAYRYANEPEWEPRRADLRKALGLPRIELIRQRRGPKGTFEQKEKREG
jgi:hypothetical protein